MKDQYMTLIFTATLLFSLTLLNFSYAAPPISESQSPSTTLDVEPPLIDHLPFAARQKTNFPLTIKAIITDNQGIQSAWLNYRVKGMDNYRVLLMRLSETTPSTFVGIIPANEVGSETIEYYIQATDTGGNTVLRGGMLFPLSVAMKQSPIFTKPSTYASDPKTVVTGGLFDLPTNSNQAWAWIAGGVIVGALIANSSDDGNPDGKSDGSTLVISGEIGFNER